jgi:hypothetical protein
MRITYLACYLAKTQAATEAGHPKREGASLLRAGITKMAATSTTCISRLVEVECGFFRRGELIATDHLYIENIAPNAMGFKTILASSDVSPDRAECRIVSAK